MAEIAELGFDRVSCGLVNITVSSH